jgi:hypothetical protein
VVTRDMQPAGFLAVSAYFPLRPTETGLSH